MRKVILIVLLDFLAVFCAMHPGIPDSMDNLLNELVDQLFTTVWPFHREDLRKTTFARTWSAAMGPSHPSRIACFSSPAYHSSFRLPRSSVASYAHCVTSRLRPDTTLNVANRSLPILESRIMHARRVNKRSGRYAFLEEAQKRLKAKLLEDSAHSTEKPLSKSERLMLIRQSRNVSIPDTPNLRSNIVERDGSTVPLILRPYQKQMVLHLMERDRFVVGDDCGLGKTLESIAALCQVWKNQPNMKAVILTKKSSVAQWAAEFNRFTKGIKVFVAIGTPTARKKAQALFEEATGPSALIEVYQSACNDAERFFQWSGHSLILDDASVVKSTATKTHKFVSQFAQQSTRCWALTATLIKNDLMEGFGIYSIVQPNLFYEDLDSFMHSFCQVRYQTIRNQMVPKIIGYKQSDIERFRNRIEDYYLGRPKHVVAQDLPVLTTRIVDVGMTKFQAEQYQQILFGMLQLGDTGPQVKTNQLSSLTYAQEIVDHPALIGYPDEKSKKLDTLVDMVTGGGDLHDEKVIVFTRFKQMVNFAIPVLSAAGIHCLRITGDEKVKERQAAVEAFQDPSHPSRIIFITTAGGEALNLQAAKALVFYDMPWSAGDYLQIIGRMIRIGSGHENCLAIHLLCKGTIDERVQDVVTAKMDLIEQVIGERVKRNPEDDRVFKADSEQKSVYNALLGDAQRLQEEKAKGKTGKPKSAARARLRTTAS